MTQQLIKEIENTLRLHFEYKGVSSGNRYLQNMGRLSINYQGAPAQKISKLLDDYFKVVNVSNLDEAFDRLRQIDNIKAIK